MRARDYKGAKFSLDSVNSGSGRLCVSPVLSLSVFL